MASTFVYINVLKEEYLFAKTGSGPIETFTIHVVALGDPLIVPQYLIMHLGSQFCIEDLKFIMMYQ